MIWGKIHCESSVIRRLDFDGQNFPTKKSLSEIELEATSKSNMITLDDVTQYVENFVNKITIMINKTYAG